MKLYKNFANSFLPCTAKLFNFLFVEWFPFTKFSKIYYCIIFF